MSSYLKICLRIQRQQILVFSVLSLQGREKKSDVPCTEASLANLQELLLLKCYLMLVCPKQSNSTFATVLQGEEITLINFIYFWAHSVCVKFCHSLAFSCAILSDFFLLEPVLDCHCFVGTVAVEGQWLCQSSATHSLQSWLWTPSSFPFCYCFPIKFYCYFAYSNRNKTSPDN